MPFKVKKVRGGYKCKSPTHKSGFSKKPQSKKKAEAQCRIISKNYYGEEAFQRNLEQALDQLDEGPETGLANSLAKDVGAKCFSLPNLTKPNSTTATDKEPIRKDGSPRKRRHRKFLGTNTPQPAV